MPFYLRHLLSKHFLPDSRAVITDNVIFHPSKVVLSAVTRKRLAQIFATLLINVIKPNGKDFLSDQRPIPCFLSVCAFPFLLISLYILFVSHRFSPYPVSFLYILLSFICILLFLITYLSTNFSSFLYPTNHFSSLYILVSSCLFFFVVFFFFFGFKSFLSQYTSYTVSFLYPSLFRIFSLYILFLSHRFFPLYPPVFLFNLSFCIHFLPRNFSLNIKPTPSLLSISVPLSFLDPVCFSFLSMYPNSPVSLFFLFHSLSAYHSFSFSNLFLFLIFLLFLFPLT